MTYLQRSATGRSHPLEQALSLIQDPGQRLPREEVVHSMRYRVSQEGWYSVAERAVIYEVGGE